MGHALSQVALPPALPRALSLAARGWGRGGEACARRWCLGRVFDCGLNVWGRATFVPKT